MIQFENFHISFMCLDKKITITLWDKSFWLSYFFWANFCYNWWIFVSSSTTFDIRYLTHNLAASWWDVRVNLFLNRLLCTYIFLKKIMNDHLIIRITFALAIITNFTIMPLSRNRLWIIIFSPCNFQNIGDDDFQYFDNRSQETKFLKRERKKRSFMMTLIMLKSAPSMPKMVF